MRSSRTILTVALVGALVSASGCSNIWHNLKPHRLQRMNRGPAPSLDPEFSSFRRSDSKSKLAHRSSPEKAATLSVNSAQEMSVRAQSE